MKAKLAVLFAFGLGSAFGANLFLNPSFETFPISPDTFSILGSGDMTSLPGWTVTGSSCGPNCVLLLTSSYTEPSNVGTVTFQPNSGDQSVDLTGGSNTVDGGVEQTLTLTPGTQYNVSFWVGNMDNRASSYILPSTVEVLVNGLTQGTFSNGNSTDNQLNWQQFSFNFTPTNASNTIQFRNATGLDDNELGLDDVSIDAAGVSGVPEPSSVVLASAGLALLGLARVRMRKF